MLARREIMSTTVAGALIAVGSAQALALLFALAFCRAGNDSAPTGPAEADPRDRERSFSDVTPM